MAAHVIHEDLPGFHGDQILFDGCEECEYRGRDPEVALQNLDVAHFRKAWARAWEWNTNKLTDGGRSISRAEAPLLRMLWAVRWQLEQAFTDGVSALLDGKDS